MLIVLWKLLELVLLVREASIHTKVPVCALGQVARLLADWLGDMEGRGVVVP